MPLDDPHAQPERKRVLFAEPQIRAMVAYVASLGHGPQVPTPQPSRGNVAEGQRLFLDHCAGCHQIAAEGGYVTGARVPPLLEATPTGRSPRRCASGRTSCRGSRARSSPTRSSTRSSRTSTTRNTRTTAADGRSGASALAGGRRHLVDRRCRARRDVSPDRDEAAHVSRMRNAVVAGVVLLLGRRRRTEPGAEHRIVPPGAPVRRCRAAAPRTARPDGRLRGRIRRRLRVRAPRHQTQYLGLAIGLAFLLLAAASILVAKRLVVSEELDEPYPDPAHPGEQEALAELVAESGSRFTRRRLVTVAGTGALGALSSR